MRHDRRTNLIEFAAIALIALGAFLLFSGAREQPLSPASAPPLLAPWTPDQEISPGWFLVGIGRRADGQLAIQLRSPQHSDAAWIVLGARGEAACASGCSKNLKAAVEFGPATAPAEGSPPDTAAIPASLQAALSAVVARLTETDQYSAPGDILDAAWDDIGPPAAAMLPDALKKTFAPLPDTRQAVALFLAALALVWLILRTLHRPLIFIEFLLLAGLTALAVWLRWPLLDLPFMEDGSIQRMAYAREPLMDILMMRTPELHHPPLTFIVLRWAMMLGGIAERAVRMPFFLASVALIPVVYALTRRLVGRVAALLVAALIAVHPALIGLSAEVNDFSLLMLFGFATLAVYAHSLNDASGPARLLIVLLSALTINGNMLGLVWVGGLLLWDWLIRPAQNRALIRLDGALLLLAAALPVLGMLAHGFLLGANAPAPQRLPGLDWGTGPWSNLVADIARLTLTPPFGFSLLALACVGAASIVRRPLSRRKSGVLLWLPAVLTVALAALAVVDRIRAAYTLPILVGLLPLAAVPVQNLAAAAELSPHAIRLRALAALLATLLLVGPLFSHAASPENTPSDLFERVGQQVQSARAPQTVAVLARTGPLATYHLCGRVELWAEREAPGMHACTLDMQILSLGMPHDWANDSMKELNARLGRLLSGKPFFLLLGREPAPLLRKWADRHCEKRLTERDLTLLRCPAPVVD